MSALGLIETRGLIAAIEGADAMVKSANVRILEKTYIGAGLVTISVTGDVAAVKSSIDVATVAIARLCGGEIVSSHVIPRPQVGVAEILLGSNKAEEGAKKHLLTDASGGQNGEPCCENGMSETSAPAQPEKADTSVQRTVQNAQAVLPVEAKKASPEKGTTAAEKEGAEPVTAKAQKPAASSKKATSLSKEEVDSLQTKEGTQKTVAMLARHTVANLRVLARQYPEFTIDKKKLSKVKKRTLLDGFTRYYTLLNS